MNARQSAFCQAYVICLDAQKAALQAGYSCKRAKQTGYDLLQLDEINSEIVRLRSIRDTEFGLQAANVLRELVAIAMTDIGGVLTWGREAVQDDDGNAVRMANDKPLMRPYCRPIPSDQMNEQERRSIKSMTLSKNGSFKLELYDRIKALELLGRHLGLFAWSNNRKSDGRVDTMSRLIADCQGPPLMPKATSYDI